MAEPCQSSPSYWFAKAQHRWDVMLPPLPVQPESARPSAQRLVGAQALPSARQLVRLPAPLVFC
jgi:hypothetical protein